MSEEKKCIICSCRYLPSETEVLITWTNKLLQVSDPAPEALKNICPACFLGELLIATRNIALDAYSTAVEVDKQCRVCRAAYSDQDVKTLLRIVNKLSPGHSILGTLPDMQETCASCMLLVFARVLTASRFNLGRD